MLKNFIKFLDLDVEDLGIWINPQNLDDFILAPPSVLGQLSIEGRIYVGDLKAFSCLFRKRHFDDCLREAVMRLGLDESALDLYYLAEMEEAAREEIDEIIWEIAEEDAEELAEDKIKEIKSYADISVNVPSWGASLS